MRGLVGFLLLSDFDLSAGFVIIDAAVVAQMNEFGGHALQDAPHDVDGGIMAVEQRGCARETHFACKAVIGKRLAFSTQIGHGASWLLSMGFRKEPKTADMQSTCTSTK